MRMPFRDAPPIPPKNDSGTLQTNAHAQKTIKTVSARYSHVANSAEKLPEIIGGTKASANAANTTTGV